MNRIKTDTCLFVDNKGVIFRVKCPFKVKLISNISTNIEVFVTGILIDNDSIILFEINDVLQHYQDCSIIFENSVKYFKEEFSNIVFEFSKCRSNRKRKL